VPTVAAHLDFETRSTCDLKKAGAHKYAEDPSTEIIVARWRLGNKTGSLADIHILGDHIAAGGTVVAHNAAFERSIWNKQLRRFRDLPELTADQQDCTMARCATLALPQSLDGAAKVVGASVLKDTDGHKLMMRMCRPKGFVDGRPEWHETDEQIARLDQYCGTDVDAECALDVKVPRLTPLQRKTWLLDQQINDRGISVDTTLARAAVELDAISAAGLDLRMRQITGLDNPGSVTQLKGWLSDAMQRDVASLAKADVADLLETAASDAAREVLSLRVKSAKTSTKKYEAMLACAGADSRARGLLQFYGANRTGRWAGRLVQVQNLPQNHLRDLDLARTVVRSGDPDLAALLFDDIGSVLSQLVRTAFVAKPGHTLAVADFSAIEARVIAWLAGEDWRMQVFNTHGKIYEASAAMMFRVPIESVTKGSDLRQKGKIAELALGYGGALGALKQMGGESMGLSDPEMTEIVARWRTANPAIVELWADVETAATLAVKTGRVHGTGHRGVCFAYDGTNLTAALPSGRKLFYHRPSFGPNRFGSTSLRYKGVDQNTKQWTNVDTYGGKLVENLVQAIARDLLAGSMLALAEDAYEIVMHVHDEVVCEIPSAGSDASLERMCAIMSRPAPWAPDLPNRADGYTTPFYRKSD